MRGGIPGIFSGEIPEEHAKTGSFPLHSTGRACCKQSCLWEFQELQDKQLKCRRVSAAPQDYRWAAAVCLLPTAPDLAALSGAAAGIGAHAHPRPSSVVPGSPAAPPPVCIIAAVMH